MPQFLGKRLREARKHRKLTQVQLAKAAKVDQSTISDLETGQSKMISGDTLIAVCNVLQIRPEWLVTGKGEMESRPDDLALTDEERELVLRRRQTPEDVVLIPRDASKDFRLAVRSLWRIHVSPVGNSLTLDKPEDANAVKKRKARRAP